jgi:hypothetical protein
VTYAFFSNGTCVTGTLVGTDTVTIGAGGAVPPSAIRGPLVTGGPYSFEAEYSSDTNFVGTGSGCEPFDVSGPAAAAAAAPATAPPGLLPLTGLAGNLYAILAVAMFGAGFALVGLSRRRPERGRHFIRKA